MTTKNEQGNEAATNKTVRTKLTRKAQLSKLLSRKSGVSIVQMQKAFGWQPHTARAALSALRKAGTAIERSDTDKGSVYRIVSEA